MDPARDTTLVESTPIDYLDCQAGFRPGLQDGNRRDEQVARRERAALGRPIVMDAAVKRRVDALWQDLGL